MSLKDKEGGSRIEQSLRPAESQISDSVSATPTTRSSRAEELPRVDHTGERWPGTGTHFSGLCTSLVAQTVKRLSSMQETWVQSLGLEDSLEKEMATHSSPLAEKIP